MLNLSELWIGDEVKIKSSGRTGTFEGKNKDGKARIKSKSKIYLVSSKNLERHTAKLEEEELLFEEPQKEIKKTFKLFPREIDLHIEKLKPDLIHAPGERIIDFQIKAFQNYLEDAYVAGVSDVTIIHGIGKGVLKSAIISLVKTDKRIKIYSEINHGGALQILL